MHTPTQYDYSVHGPRFIRTEQVLTHVWGDIPDGFESVARAYFSISEAKRASRLLQNAIDGGLGRGSVGVRDC